MAINAVKTTAPFEPPPTCLKSNIIPIEFTFDYNVVDLTKNKI